MKSRRAAAVALFFFAASLVFADRFEDAVQSFQQGDLFRAETVLQTLLKEQRNNAAALGLLGAVYDGEKRFVEADATYRRALAITPTSVALLNNYGNHQQSTGDLAGAKSTYLHVLRLDPKRTNANMQLAVLALKDGRGAEASTYLANLPETDRATPQVQILQVNALYLAHRDAEAAALLSRAAPAINSDARLCFNAGLAFASARRYAQAEQFFSRALEQSPGDFDILYNLGLAAFHAGDLGRARDVLEAALAHQPEDVDAIYNLAVVDIASDQREAALALLAEAGRLAPKRPNVQRTIAETASALGFYADALVAYQSYLQLVPHDESAEREYLFMLAVNGRRDEGLTALRKFVNQHPRDVTGHYEIGTLESSSNPEDALAHLDQALAIDSGFGPARFGRGVVRLQQGRAAAAIPDLEYAEKRYPGNPNVLDRLGEAYLASNRTGDAVRVLEEARRAAPHDGRVLLHLSRALAKAGRTDEAREAMAAFRAVGPSQTNQIPAAGLVDFLALPPEARQARYREVLTKQLAAHPDDPALNLRALKSALSDGDAAPVSALASKLAALEPPGPIAAEAAHLLVQDRYYSEAKPLLQSALKSEPNAESRLDFALTVSNLNGPAAGINELNRISAADRSGDYFLARAQMLYGANKGDEAMAAIEEAMRAAPTRIELYKTVALFLTRNHHPDAAVTLLTRAERTLPADAEVELLKAGAEAAGSHADRAELTLRAIERRWPEWPAAYTTYGILLEGQKRAEAAKAQLEAAEALGAASSELYLYLARATLDATPEEIEAANNAINQALVLAPDDPWVQETAGRIDYARKDYEAAVDHLAAAIRLRPNYMQARFTLAQAYRALGRKDDAAREAAEFQRLRAENPNGDDELSGSVQ